MTTKPKLYEKVAVRLTDAQLIEMGEELAAKRLEYNQVDADKAEALGNFNAKLKTLDAEIDDIARQIDDREKHVDIEVREEPDDGRNVIALVRVDNGQLLKTREMTLNEMAESAQRKAQPSLFGKDGKPVTDDPERHELNGTEKSGGKAATKKKRDAAEAHE